MVLNLRRMHQLQIISSRFEYGPLSIREDKVIYEEQEDIDREKKESHLSRISTKLSVPLRYVLDLIHYHLVQSSVYLYSIINT